MAGVSCLADFNFTAAIIGPPGYGKTTLAKQLAAQHLAKHKAGIVLAHDPVGQFGGSKFSSAEEFRRTALKSKTIARLCSIGGVASDVTALADAIGQRVNTAANARMPILVVYDESSLLDTSGPTHMGTADRQLLAIRRHRGIGLVYNLQRPNQVMQSFFFSCTDAYVFWSLPKFAAMLDDCLSLPAGTLEAAGACRLAKHQYLHVQPIKGVCRD